MVVKVKENPIEIIQNILKDQNGILPTSDLSKYGIPRTYLSILEKKGEIQRISRGVYSATGNILRFFYEKKVRLHDLFRKMVL